MFILSKIIFTETSRIIFEQKSGHCDPGKFTEKINHHTRFTKFISYFLQKFYSLIPYISIYDPI